jgi:hypothetical protein
MRFPNGVLKKWISWKQEGGQHAPEYPGILYIHHLSDFFTDKSRYKNSVNNTPDLSHVVHSLLPKAVYCYLPITDTLIFLRDNIRRASYWCSSGSLAFGRAIV